MYDEEKGEWVRKWGYKGRAMREEGEWLVELPDEKKGGKDGEGEGRIVRTQPKRERMERARRQERKERSNLKRAGRGRG